MNVNDMRRLGGSDMRGCVGCSGSRLGDAGSSWTDALTSSTSYLIGFIAPPLLPFIVGSQIAAKVAGYDVTTDNLQPPTNSSEAYDNALNLASQGKLTPEQLQNLACTLPQDGTLNNIRAGLNCAAIQWNNTVKSTTTLVQTVMVGGGLLAGLWFFFPDILAARKMRGAK